MDRAMDVSIGRTIIHHCGDCMGRSSRGGVMAVLRDSQRLLTGGYTMSDDKKLTEILELAENLGFQNGLRFGNPAKAYAKLQSALSVLQSAPTQPDSEHIAELEVEVKRLKTCHPVEAIEGKGGWRERNAELEGKLHSALYALNVLGSECDEADGHGLARFAATTYKRLAPASQEGEAVSG